MKLDLINSVIADTADKESISDGVFTLGELHSDRIVLIVNLFTLLNKIYKLKGEEHAMWVADYDSEGIKTVGYFHVGLKSEGTNANLGAKVSNVVRSYFDSLNPTILITSPNYKPLVESLKHFDYE